MSDSDSDDGRRPPEKGYPVSSPPAYDPSFPGPSAMTQPQYNMGPQTVQTYPSAPGGYAPQPAAQAGVYVAQSVPAPPPQVQMVYVDKNNLNSMQSAIPIMPMWCAILLCVVNCILPGIGTMIASMTVFCCANLSQTQASKFGVFCINFWVGWAQLCTVFLFFIGWVWSIGWGVLFITLSSSLYGRTTTTTTTTMQVVTAVPQQAQTVSVNVGAPPSYPPGGYTNAGMGPK